jgi:hypothetical protein
MDQISTAIPKLGHYSRCLNVLIRGTTSQFLGYRTCYFIWENLKMFWKGTNVIILNESLFIGEHYRFAKFSWFRMVFFGKQISADFYLFDKFSITYDTRHVKS